MVLDCRNYTGTASRILCREVVVLCPCLGESTNIDSTVLDHVCPLNVLKYP